MRKFYFIIGLVFIVFGILLLKIDYWLGISLVGVGVFFEFKGNKKLDRMLKGISQKYGLLSTQGGHSFNGEVLKNSKHVLLFALIVYLLSWLTFLLTGPQYLNSVLAIVVAGAFIGLSTLPAVVGYWFGVRIAKSDPGNGRVAFNALLAFWFTDLCIRVFDIEALWIGSIVILIVSFITGANWSYSKNRMAIQ